MSAQVLCFVFAAEGSENFFKELVLDQVKFFFQFCVLSVWQIMGSSFKKISSICGSSFF